MKIDGIHLNYFHFTMLQITPVRRAPKNRKRCRSGHPVGNLPSTSLLSTRSLERAPLIFLAIVQPLLVRDHQLQIRLVQVEDVT